MNFTAPLHFISTCIYKLDFSARRAVENTGANISGQVPETGRDSPYNGADNLVPSAHLGPSPARLQGPQWPGIGQQRPNVPNQKNRSPWNMEVSL